MPRRSGFISEHTAEYFLVQSIMRAYASGETQAIPIYYWATREGSRLGIASGNGVFVRVAAIYPRRPKVEETGDSKALVKFNPSLFEAKDVGCNLGLPVFAGVPLTTSLFDLGEMTSCAWFDLLAVPRPQEDVFCRLDFSDIPPTVTCDRHVQRLTEAELLARIQSDCEVREWPEWVNTISVFRRHAYTKNFIFGGLYKPMYIITLPSTSTR